MDNNVQRAAMSNVIQFPVKNYKPHVPQTEKELKAQAQQIKGDFRKWVQEDWQDKSGKLAHAYLKTADDKTDAYPHPVLEVAKQQ